MASSLPPILFILLLLLNAFCLISEAQNQTFTSSFSVSFPLRSSKKLAPSLGLAEVKQQRKQQQQQPLPQPTYNFKTSFKYSMALIVSIPIGTPPQKQDMVLDTGSQLSWIQCHKKAPPPPVKAFDPSLSSTFSVLPCTHPVCKPRIPDYSLPTDCDQKRLCHYSYFYADGTLAEGNLVREKFTFSNSLSTPPMVLGCAASSGEDRGILGMNLGRLSFASQTKLQKFSYCLPAKHGNGVVPAGGFYLGQNPSSGGFIYTSLLTFPNGQRMPNFDPLAYTIGLTGIRVGAKKLAIPLSAFRPDAGGSGQTMIDSGTQYTFLVEEAYNKVREEVARLAGARMKKDYVFGGALDMCFDGGDAAEAGRLIGDMALEFDKGVEIVIPKERIMDGVEGGVSCVGIGRSQSLGVASNIIGNFHQQEMWVEFDLANRRVGFGKADCSKSV